MASYSGSNESIPIGPAKTFVDQCNFFLDTYWENWKTSQSYMIPPVFSYKHLDLSDETAENSQAGQVIKEPPSDDAKNIVYEAIRHLIEDGIEVPFIAIYDLDMKKIKDSLINFFPQLKFQHLQMQLKNRLDELIESSEFHKSRQFSKFILHGQIDEIFLHPPSKILQRLEEYFDKKKASEEPVGLDWEKMKITLNEYFRKYDFLLLGTKIGIVQIQVQNLIYREFSNTDKLFSEKYGDDTRQLTTNPLEDGLLPLLAECVGIEIRKEFSARKIILFPELSEQRFDEWIGSGGDAEKTEERIGDMKLFWFQEDMPLLDDKLREILRMEGFSISNDIYQTFAPIISGLRSAVFSKNMPTHVTSDESEFLELDRSSAISESDQASTISDSDLFSTTSEFDLSPAASESDITSATRKDIIFKGPAKQEFMTFLEQCTFFLNTHCVDWKRYKSYMIPPVFSYRNPDVSDEAFEQVQRTSHVDRIFIDRPTEDAGHIVFNAIYQLIQDEVQGPFIAVHDLNLEVIKHQLVHIFPELKFQHLQHQLEEKLDELLQAPKFFEWRLFLKGATQDHFNRIFQNSSEKCLQELEEYFNKTSNPKKTISHNFPDLDWRKLRSIFTGYFREYDFVLIGPKIGIVAIEVKTSKFRQHWGINDRYLPNQYDTGIEQLKSVDDSLLPLLSECAGFELPRRFRARKILFSPNLSRYRFAEWKNRLSSNNIERVNQRISDVVLWFKEDIGNLEKNKPPLYTELRRLLEMDDYSTANETYETCGPIVAGLRSVVFLSDRPQDVILDKLNFSEFDHILAIHEAIERQDPLKAAEKYSKRKPQKLSQHSLLVPSPESSIAAFLTPDQQHALNGPNRQFILGAAGTGKMTIIQIKALQLLRDGQSVLIFSPRHFSNKYRELFESYGYKNYAILSWQIKNEELFGDYYQALIDHSQLFIQCDFLEIFSVLGKRIDEIEKTSKKFGLLTKYDNIFMDDACDISQPKKDNLEWIFAYAGIMIFAEYYYKNSKNVVWLALDSNISHGSQIGSMNLYHVIEELLKIATNNTSEKLFNVSLLRRVMRCPENVFNIANDMTQWTSEAEPILGHKIPGAPSNSIKRNCQNKEEAFEVLWDEVLKFIRDFVDHDFDLTQIAIVAGYYSSSRSGIRHFLFKKFKEEFSSTSQEGSSNKEVDCLEDGSWKKYDGVSFLAVNGKSLGIYDYDHVSSLEWPVVIYAHCSDIEDYDYHKYCVMSRATAKLIHISVAYDYQREMDWRSTTPLSISSPTVVENPDKPPGHALESSVGSAMALDCLDSGQENILQGSLSHSFISYELELSALGQISYQTNGVLPLEIKYMDAPLDMDLNSYYNNFGETKGLALVISNHKYGINEHRTGTFVDLANIHILFNRLQYKVICKIDRKKDEMLSDIEKFAVEFATGNYDSCVVVLLTNGNRDGFVGTDGITLEEKTLFKIITKNHALRGKPIIFIIQACRGSLVDPQNTQLSKNELLSLVKIAETEAKKSFRSTIPDCDDMFILYSTTPGYYSWRNKERGSWFIDTVCREISEHAHEPWADIMTLAIRITKRYSDLVQTYKDYVELPSIKSNLDKKFHFFSGYKS